MSQTPKPGADSPGRHAGTSSSPVSGTGGGTASGAGPSSLETGVSSGAAGSAPTVTRGGSLAAPAGTSPATPSSARSVTSDLLLKYDRPGPRYTSYPTAVEFNEEFTEARYIEKLEEAAAAESEPISLYIHLPFCHERCSFCGCFVVITQKPEVSGRYLEYVPREISMLAERLRNRRQVVQYHWGGGTPTYLAIEQMKALHTAVTSNFAIDRNAEVAIEVDPRVTTHEQVDWLRSAGFNRLSMGVQDFTFEVQDAVNRVQPEEMTRELFDYSRRAGFESINIDLIYGLPLQTAKTFGLTLDAVIAMRPDRVAVYSFAHVPWIRGNQKRIDPQQLPPRGVKFELFGSAIDRFLAAGYRQIGMDHFALPGDELALAAERRTLHRNFMGYTTKPATDMLGVGISSIGDVRGAFAQNVKKLSTYYATLDNGKFPIERGYVLDADDLLRRFVITQLMCNFHLDIREVERRFGIAFGNYFAVELAELSGPDAPVAHGFMEIHPDRLEVLPKGHLFIRNICMTFDRYLRTKHLDKPVFSRTI